MMSEVTRGDSASNTCPHPVPHQSRHLSHRYRPVYYGIHCSLMLSTNYWVEKIICEKQQFSWKEASNIYYCNGFKLLFGVLEIQVSHSKYIFML